MTIIGLTGLIVLLGVIRVELSRREYDRLAADLDPAVLVA